MWDCPCDFMHAFFVRHREELVTLLFEGGRLRVVMMCMMYMMCTMWTVYVRGSI